MVNFLKLLLLLILMFFGVMNFGKPAILQENEVNLIKNSKFEINNGPSIVGWKVNENPGFYVVKQAPVENSGQWSLCLEPGEFADYYITKISGSNEYVLNFWWKIKKKKDGFIVANGSVQVGVLSNNKILQEQSMTISNNDTEWTHHSLNINLSTLTSDTILVRLSGGRAKHSMHATLNGLFLFNDVQLNKQ